LKLRSLKANEAAIIINKEGGNGRGTMAEVRGLEVVR